MLEDPRITRAMRTGYPYPECDELPPPRCPCCGAVCEFVYYVNGDAFGCDECVEVQDATECSDCYGGLYGEL